METLAILANLWGDLLLCLPSVLKTLVPPHLPRSLHPSLSYGQHLELPLHLWTELHIPLLHACMPLVLFPVSQHKIIRSF